MGNSSSCSDVFVSLFICVVDFLALATATVFFAEGITSGVGVAVFDSSILTEAGS
jgi:hypothetical protein